jgi:glutathione S-transferase
MLKLYHLPISFNSRRVWICLLEKKLDFKLVEMKLDGDQYQSEFLKMNPFHHIPVLEADGFPIIESFAILDYLETKYPTPALLPSDPQDLAIVRMVQMVTLTEFIPAMTPLLRQMMGFGEETPEKIEQSKEKIGVVLNFFAEKLRRSPYFGGENLSLAELVAGTAIPFLPQMGIEMEDYPKIKAWCDRLMQRSSWQETQPTPEAIAAFKSQMKELMSKR